MSVSPTPCEAECVEGPVSTPQAPICVPVPTDGGHLEGEGRVKVSNQGCTKYMSCKNIQSFSRCSKINF